MRKWAEAEFWVLEDFTKHKALGEVINDPETTVFLSVETNGSGGLKRLRDLIDKGYVDVLITSGANLTMI